MQSVDNKTEIITDIKQLTEVFFSGCKTEEKIGVESEKLLVKKENFKALTYPDTVKILESFDGNIYQKVYENDNLTGLKSDFGTVSLEPGSQVEISLIPFETIKEISSNLMRFYSDLTASAEKIGAKVLNSGIQPISTYNEINIIPKKRYEYMSEYLPEHGEEPFVMMRETAGIQANFDYKTEEDALQKISVALKMSSIVASIYANSPVRNGKLTGYKTYRALSWTKVDEKRCGLTDKRLFDKNSEFTFEDYAKILLEIPVIFLKRGNDFFKPEITFGEFMKNGYNGLKPTREDWETHISLYFPDVRLKNHIEIRNHDAQNSKMTFSVPAFWKGIIYNKDAICAVDEILEKYTYEDFMNLRAKMPETGIFTKLGNIEIIDFVKEFFDISSHSLKQNGEGEEKYLNPVYKYISEKKMPADDNVKNIF